jgi:hypothetical protein
MKNASLITTGLAISGAISWFADSPTLSGILFFGFAVTVWLNRGTDNIRTLRKVAALEAELIEAQAELVVVVEELAQLKKRNKKKKKQNQAQKLLLEVSRVPLEEPVLLDIVGDQAELVAAPAKRIITRTTSVPASQVLLDDWAEKLDWTAAELSMLLSLFRAQMTIREIAISMNLDQKDIAHKLARLAFGAKGDLELIDQAPKNGTRWTPDQSRRLETHFKAGKSLQQMAATLGRTQIALAWRLLDDKDLNVVIQNDPK